MGSFPIQEPHPRPVNAYPQATGHSSMQLPSQNSAAGVNPSLLHTSPAKPPPRSGSRETLRQLNAASVHNVSRVSQNPTASRHHAASPTETSANSASGSLRRSNTTANTRPKSAQSSFDTGDNLNRSNSIGQPPRTASPLKRFGKPSLGSISESKATKRTSSHRTFPIWAVPNLAVSANLPLPLL